MRRDSRFEGLGHEPTRAARRGSEDHGRRHRDARRGRRTLPTLHRSAAGSPRAARSCRSSASAPRVRSRSGIPRPRARRCPRCSRASSPPAARLIDTSPMYSSAERVLGELLTAKMHQQAFLATKVWTRGRESGIEQMTALRAAAEDPAARSHPGAQPARPGHAARDAARVEGRRTRALPRRHALHRECLPGPRAGARARAAGLRAVQLLARDARGGAAPAAAGRRARRGGARQPAVRGRRSVPARARPGAAGLGGGNRCRQLGVSWR